MYLTFKAQATRYYTVGIDLIHHLITSSSLPKVTFIPTTKTFRNNITHHHKYISESHESVMMPERDLIAIIVLLLLNNYTTSLKFRST